MNGLWLRLEGKRGKNMKAEKHNRGKKSTDERRGKHRDRIDGKSKLPELFLFEL